MDILKEVLLGLGIFLALVTIVILIFGWYAQNHILPASRRYRLAYVLDGVTDVKALAPECTQLWVKHGPSREVQPVLNELREGELACAYDTRELFYKMRGKVILLHRFTDEEMRE